MGMTLRTTSAAALWLVLAAGAGSSADSDVLRNPKSLRSGLKASGYEQMLSGFKDPPADFRMMPLWVWNDELEWPRLREQLQQLHQRGFGGVFIHPRPGLMTEYMGPEWMDLWKKAIAEGKRLGMLVNIYDENSYPAGFGGGHVPATAPETGAQYVELSVVEPASTGSIENQSQWRAGSTVAAFELDRDAAGQVMAAHRILRPTQASGRSAVALFNLRRAAGNAWTAGFPYVDLTNPRTAPAFLETTYERYRRQFGDEFGKTVQWSFQDEPLLATTGPRNPRVTSLPLSSNTLAEFRRRCGYDLRDELASLFFDVGDWKRVRFDYWQTLHDLFLENFLQPVARWCDRYGLQFTGHFMEHEWPYPKSSPADMSYMAFQHMPGIDLLEGTELRLTGSDPLMLFTIKEVASVANQTGRRAFAESFGVAGWDSTFEHYKRMGDWLMAHGVNFFSQHGVFATVRGARKRDHPQSFSDHAAWWPYYRLHADQVARVSFALWQGEAKNRLLVLQPTTSGFLWGRASGPTPELDRLRAGHPKLVQFLADQQIDFDLGDEYLMEWLGDAGGGGLRIGKAEYRLVVWPRGMANVRRQTVGLLDRYLAGGGEILALEMAPVLVDGRRSDAIELLRSRFPRQWRTVAELPELAGEIQRRLPPRVQFREASRPNVGHHLRFLANGDAVHFFANSGLAPVDLHVRTPGGGVEEWNPESGAMSAARYQKGADGWNEFPVSLPAAGSRLFYVRKEGAGTMAPEVRPPGGTRKLEVADLRATPSGPNVLVLDYCDVEVRGERFENVNTWRANWLVWEGHGFQRPVWDDGVQFRRRIIDLRDFGADSGFTASYRFHVSDRVALDGLQLAIESPELYQVSVNGQAVRLAGGQSWLDPHIRRAGIAALARMGENVVRIEARPFNVRMEVENIYLLGNFSAVAAERGFRLAAPVPAALGSWRTQGRPFFSDSMLYEGRVDVPPGVARLRVELPGWSGSLVEVLLDGKSEGLIAWQPHGVEFGSSPGRHNVAVRVVATPRNLFGPFHNPEKPRMRAWPAAWMPFPERQPPGAAYDLLDYGLMEPFRVLGVASAQ